MKLLESWLSIALIIPSALCLLLAVFAGPVFAAVDAYPSKPVRFVVANSAGSSVDIIGRLIAGKLSERLGKQMVVENHGGAGGVLGDGFQGSP